MMRSSSARSLSWPSWPAPRFGSSARQGPERAMLKKKVQAPFERHASTAEAQAFACSKVVRKEGRTAITSPPFAAEAGGRTRRPAQAQPGTGLSSMVSRSHGLSRGRERTHKVRQCQAQLSTLNDRERSSGPEIYIYLARLTARTRRGEDGAHEVFFGSTHTNGAGASGDNGSGGAT